MPFHATELVFVNPIFYVSFLVLPLNDFAKNIRIIVIVYKQIVTLSPFGLYDQINLIQDRLKKHYLMYKILL